MEPFEGLGCLSCGQGFHAECPACDHINYMFDPCDCLPVVIMAEGPSNKINGEGGQRAVGRPRKPDDEVQDLRSTHRRRGRATLQSLGRLKPGQPCEWQGKKNVGGGNHPIIGCVNGVAYAVHHGPKKLYLGDDPDLLLGNEDINVATNLHYICTSCHNRWHSANDPCYSVLGPFPEHAPFEALLSELQVSYTAPTHDECTLQGVDS